MKNRRRICKVVICMKSRDLHEGGIWSGHARLPTSGHLLICSLIRQH